MRMILGIGSGVAIFLIALAFCTLIPGGNGSIQLMFAILASTIIYFMWVFPYSTCQVPPNKAWVLGNSFVSESSKELKTFTGYRTIKAQKEFQAGFHWKFFWERLVWEVDMSRQILVESEPEKFYTLDDKSLVRIQWVVPCTPLPGNIINFIRMPESDIRKQVFLKADKFVQGYVGALTKIHFNEAQMAQIEGEFERLFGGPSLIDEDHERPMGIWTGTPRIIDIDQPKEVQAAQNFEQKMDAVIRVAGKMVADSKGMLKPEQAFKLALVGSGDAKIDFVELAGTLFPAQGGGKKNKGNNPQNN